MNNEENEDIKKTMSLLREVAKHTEETELSRQLILIRVGYALALLAGIVMIDDTSNAISTPINNEDGITVKQLKEWVKDLPDVDANGESYEVWISANKGWSKLATELCILNEGDVIISHES